MFSFPFWFPESRNQREHPFSLASPLPKIKPKLGFSLSLSSPTSGQQLEEFLDSLGGGIQARRELGVLHPFEELKEGGQA
jgi:hypothetical protein